MQWNHDKFLGNEAAFINIKKARFYTIFYTAFYSLDTEPEPVPEPEPEPYLSKVGTGTIINSYGLAKLHIRHHCGSTF